MECSRKQSNDKWFRHYIADMHVKKNDTSLDSESESGHAISNLGNGMIEDSLDGEYVFPFLFLVFVILVKLQMIWTVTADCHRVNKI
jgi:hypothetical protein